MPVALFWFAVETNSQFLFPKQPVAKKIRVLNSPFGRDYERVSDCNRWCELGDAYMVDGQMMFRRKFVEMIQRQSVEHDPTGADDGLSRRWANRESGFPGAGAAALHGNLINGRLIVTSPSGIPAKQLLLIEEVGTGSFVTGNPDKLTRRQPPRRTGRSPLQSPA